MFPPMDRVRVKIDLNANGEQFLTVQSIFVDGSGQSFVQI